MTRERADGTEIVAVSIRRGGQHYHELDDHGPACDPSLDWTRIDRPVAESKGYDACEHCFGEVLTGSHSGLRARLLEMEPDEVST